MTITAKVIADSVSPDKIRLTTLQLRYPKFIHGEFMTHRVFSRNASSSRAIPVEKLAKDVYDDPAMPIHWGANQKGMQASQEIESIEEAKKMWLAAARQASVATLAMANMGIHKQVANRLLEPFCHINVVVTATEWSNFFALRDHPDAQPEMRELAKQMKAAMGMGVPIALDYEGWHLPYVDKIYLANLCIEDAIRSSVARCARVSYLTGNGKPPSLGEDLDLCRRLINSHPMHASPAEHQATPDYLSYRGVKVLGWKRPHLHGSFRGWRQYRKTLPGEAQ